jgi:hypothetical protein
MTSLADYFKNWAALGLLVQDQVPESVHLDFKRAPYAGATKADEKRHTDKEELRRDAAAFSNSHGGWIVIGVEEDEHGRAGNIVGIDSPGAQETFVRDVLSRSVEPAFEKDALKVTTINDPANPSRGVVVVQVNACDPGFPRAVLIDERMEFWIRSDKSKRRMTYSQLRDDFLEGAKISAQVRQKLSAREELWKATRQVGRGVVALLSFIDVITKEEYCAFANGRAPSNIKPYFDRLLNHDEIKEKLLLYPPGQEVSITDHLRPHVSEESWLLFENYSRLMARIAVTIQLGRQQGQVGYWIDDSLVKTLLPRILDKSEVATIKGMGGILAIKEMVERKMAKMIGATETTR